MKNAINVRQICIIMLCFSAVSKLMMYPTFAAGECGNALWLPALVNVALQTAAVWVVAYVCSKTDKTFFALLSDTFGKVTAKIIFFFLALFFIVNTAVPILEQKLLVHISFYDTIPSLIVFLPFFFFSVYAGCKRLTNVGRSADVCLPIFAVIMALMLAIALTCARWENMLPFFKQPPVQLATSTLSSVFRFTDSAFMLVFMGHFKYKKGDCTKITLSYAAGGLIVIAFMVVFYAVYGELAKIQPFALTKITVCFSAIDMLGRIDLILIYALDIVMLFAIVLNIQMSAYCFSKTFNWDNRPVYSIIINALLLTFVIIFNVNYREVQQVAAQWLWIPAVIFAYALPLLTLVCRRKYEKV